MSVLSLVNSLASLTLFQRLDNQARTNQSASLSSFEDPPQRPYLPPIRELSSSNYNWSSLLNPSTLSEPWGASEATSVGNTTAAPSLDDGPRSFGSSISSGSSRFLQNSLFSLSDLPPVYHPHPTLLPQRPFSTAQNSSAPTPYSHSPQHQTYVQNPHAPYEPSGLSAWNANRPPMQNIPPSSRASMYMPQPSRQDPENNPFTDLVEDRGGRRVDNRAGDEGVDYSSTVDLPNIPEPHPYPLEHSHPASSYSSYVFPSSDLTGITADFPQYLNSRLGSNPHPDPQPMYPQPQDAYQLNHRSSSSSAPPYTRPSLENSGMFFQRAVYPNQDFDPYPEQLPLGSQVPPEFGQERPQQSARPYYPEDYDR